MSNLKRFLAMTLVIMMMVSGLVATVGAAKFADVDALENDLLSEATDLLSDLGIVKGRSDGTFDPAASVNRQEMAMFVARIDAALGIDYFNRDAISYNDAGVYINPTSFADLDKGADPTFLSAIRYCSDKKIIEGRNADTFDPKATVTLQEAVKMLMTSLGYTGLAYPMGYVTKAYEENTKLLTGDLTKIPLTQKLNRGEVALLLYNYFYSYYTEVVVKYNGVSGQMEPTAVVTPVMQKYGVTEQTGYVTKVIGNYGAQNRDKVYIPNTNTLIEDNIGIPGTDMSEKYAASQSGGDIIISYLDVTSLNTTPVTYTTTQRNIVKKSADLGIAKDTDLTTLLGKKVQIYTSSNNLIKVPQMRVLAKDVEVKSADVKAEALNFNTDVTDAEIKLGDVSSLTIGEAVYNQKSPVDVKNDDILVYTGKELTRGTTADAQTFYKLIKDGKGNFMVRVIDNGTYVDGMPNIKIVFAPYDVAVFQKTDGDNDNKIKVYGQYAKGELGFLSYQSKNYNTATSDSPVKIADLKENDGFVWTAIFDKIYIVSKLTKIESTYATAASSGEVSFISSVDNKIYKATLDRNVNAIYGNSLSASKGLDTLFTRYYTLYKDASDRIVFVRQADWLPTASDSVKYAVIASGAAQLSSGWVSYQAIDASNNQIITLTASSNTFAINDVVAYKGTANIYAMTSAAFKGSASSTYSSTVNANVTFGGNTSLSLTAADDVTTLAVESNALNTVITSNTTFIFFNSTDETAARTGSSVAPHLASRTEFNAFMNATIRDIDKIVVVSTGTTTVTGEANLVIVYSSSYTVPEKASDFAVIKSGYTSVETINGVYYYKSTATSNSGEITVVSTDAALLTRGNIVKVTTTMIGSSRIVTAVATGANNSLAPYTAAQAGAITKANVLTQLLKMDRVTGFTGSNTILIDASSAVYLGPIAVNAINFNYDNVLVGTLTITAATGAASTISVADGSATIGSVSYEVKTGTDRISKDDLKSGMTNNPADYFIYGKVDATTGEIYAAVIIKTVLADAPTP